LRLSKFPPSQRCGEKPALNLPDVASIEQTRPAQNSVYPAAVAPRRRNPAMRRWLFRRVDCHSLKSLSSHRTANSGPVATPVFLNKAAENTPWHDVP
jgi:hypothetical protein